jgi:NTE family protein
MSLARLAPVQELLEDKCLTQPLPHHATDLDLLREALVPLIGRITTEDVREIAASGTWVELEGGRRLFSQGDAADALYLLVHGRLRASVSADDGSERVLGDLARGEAVGEMALLGRGVRSAHIDALRDSRLFRLEVEAFHEIASQHPDFLWNLSRLVIRRLERSPGATRSRPAVRTIAIACSGGHEMRERFVTRLAAALEPYGTAAILRSADLPPSIERDGDPGRLAAWLDEHETRHRFLLVITDPAEESRRLLFRQADRILIVCPADDDPGHSQIARWLTSDRDRQVRVRRDLVLLHPDGSRPPTGTARWLEAHELTRAHHLREDRDGDYERLGRFLAGRAVGLVFAGGGARGFAHLGVLRALKEEGVTVDLLGGTSIGAILAAAVASDWDDHRLNAALHGSFVATNPANDFQLLPFVSLVKGRKMERLLRRNLGEGGIEDLWLPFYCVSSNLTASTEAVHTRGPLWKALRASASIAGVFPPAVIDGQLHIDGGTFDNLPVATARRLDAGHVIACDIMRSVHAEVGFEAVPTAGRLLIDRLLGRRRYRVPGMMATMMQAGFLSGLERARSAATDADLFLEPKPGRVRFLDWKALDCAAKLGYDQTREALGDPDVRERLDAILRRPATEPARSAAMIVGRRL